MFIFIRITTGRDVVPERTFAQYKMEIITKSDDGVHPDNSQ